MTILKFLLVVILLLILIPMVRIGMMLWTMRRTLRDARDAMRGIYGDGPFREPSTAGHDRPRGEYADFEEIPGGRPATTADSGTDTGAAAGGTSQVVEAEFEEI